MWQDPFTMNSSKKLLDVWRMKPRNNRACEQTCSLKFKCWKTPKKTTQTESCKPIEQVLKLSSNCKSWQVLESKWGIVRILGSESCFLSKLFWILRSNVGSERVTKQFPMQPVCNEGTMLKLWNHEDSRLQSMCLLIIYLKITYYTYKVKFNFC